MSLNKQTRLLLRAQTNKQGCFYELNRIYICGVHLGGSCLKLLQVVLVFHLYLYLFW